MEIAQMQSTCMKVSPFNLDKIYFLLKYPICLRFDLHVVRQSIYPMRAMCLRL